MHVDTITISRSSLKVKIENVAKVVGATSSDGFCLQ